MRSKVARFLAPSILVACGGGARSASDEPPTQRACAGLPDATMDRGVADLRSNVDVALTLYRNGSWAA